MTDRGWKQFERRLARALGTERIPVTGERDGADFENALFCYQAKKRQMFPGYVARWLDGVRTRAASRSPAKVGVVILQRPRGRDAGALVVLAFADWLELHVGRRDLRAQVAMPAPSQGGPGTLPKAPRATICLRPGCGKPLPPGPRRGSPRRFCSSACRRRAWRAAHQRTRAAIDEAAGGAR